MTRRFIAMLALAAALAACTPGASPSVQAPSVSTQSSAPSLEVSPSDEASPSGSDDAGEASASPS